MKRSLPRRAPAKRKTRAPLMLLLALIALLAFYAGRWSSPSPEPEMIAAAECPEQEAPDCPAVASLASTSTIGMCPCPRPRPAKTLAIKRKPKPPVETPPHEGPDPTAATAKYLREHAQDLGQCAPKSGIDVRVHIEVTVMPKGAVERVRITNLDPLPPLVSECVTKTVLAFSPPGFDASRSEVFALTVVL